MVTYTFCNESVTSSSPGDEVQVNEAWKWIPLSARSKLPRANSHNASNPWGVEVWIPISNNNAIVEGVGCFLCPWWCYRYKLCMFPPLFSFLLMVVQCVLVVEDGNSVEFIGWRDPYLAHCTVPRKHNRPTMYLIELHWDLHCVSWDDVEIFRPQSRVEAHREGGATSRVAILTSPISEPEPESLASASAIAVSASGLRRAKIGCWVGWWVLEVRCQRGCAWWEGEWQALLLILLVTRGVVASAR